MKTLIGIRAKFRGAQLSFDRCRSVTCTFYESIAASPTKMTLSALAIRPTLSRAAVGGVRWAAEFFLTWCHSPSYDVSLPYASLNMLLGSQIPVTGALRKHVTKGVIFTGLGLALR